jgi:hypothetical protein
LGKGKIINGTITGSLDVRKTRVGIMNRIEDEEEALTAKGKL